jgi:hypothetical protein
LEDIHDILINTGSLTNGQVLSYNSTSGLWENTNQINTSSFAVTSSANIFYGDQTITGSLAIKDSETDFLIEGNGFSQTYLTSNGAIILNPGYGGVEMVGSYRTFKATDITADGTLIVKGSTTLGDDSADTTIISGSLKVSGPLRGNTISGGLDVNGGITGSVKGNLDGVAAYATTIVVANSGTTTDTNLFPTFTLSPVLASYTSLYSHASSSFFFNGVTRRVHMEGFVVSGSNNIAEISGSFNVSGSTNLTGSVTVNQSRIDNGWTAYTPEWTAASVNPVINNGTIEGYYKVIGKTCFVRGNIAMGSTTTFGTGEWYVSMPFTASHADAILMTVTLLDNGSGWYNATMAGARAGFNHKAPIQYQSAGGTANDINATQPFTWANSDRFMWNGSYEIA